MPDRRHTAGTQHERSQCQLAWPTTVNLFRSRPGCHRGQSCHCVSARAVSFLSVPTLHLSHCHPCRPCAARAASQGRRHHSSGGIISSTAASRLHVGGSAATLGEGQSAEARPTLGSQSSARSSGTTGGRSTTSTRWLGRSSAMVSALVGCLGREHGAAP